MAACQDLAASPTPPSSDGLGSRKSRLDRSDLRCISGVFAGVGSSRSERARSLHGAHGGSAIRRFIVIRVCCARHRGGHGPVPFCAVGTWIVAAWDRYFAGRTRHGRVTRETDADGQVETLYGICTGQSIGQKGRTGESIPGMARFRCRRAPRDPFRGQSEVIVQSFDRARERAIDTPTLVSFGKNWSRTNPSTANFGKSLRGSLRSSNKLARRATVRA